MRSSPTPLPLPPASPLLSLDSTWWYKWAILLCSLLRSDPCWCLRDHMQSQGFKRGSTICKANSLPAVLSLVNILRCFMEGEFHTIFHSGQMKYRQNNPLSSFSNNWILFFIYILDMVSFHIPCPTLMVIFYTFVIYNFSTQNGVYSNHILLTT